MIVSLLRGVNVGGHQIKMDALRELYEAQGLRDVQTLIQSGNVVFSTQVKDLGKLAKRLEDAIEKCCGFRSDVVLRTTVEMRGVLARNPFEQREAIDPASLLVIFLAGEPDPDGCLKVKAMDIAPEELFIDGREVYAYFPNGLARPKLSWPQVGKALKTPATGRNLNTVRKLLAMAERLEVA